MKKTTLLFPGQGSQRPGMLDAMDAGDPITAEIFAQTLEILGEPATVLDGEDKLQSTVYVQICLLIAGVISGKQLLASGVKPDFVAGHSVGAFSAAVISGVLSFKQALALVKNRGTLMENAYPKGYGMAALVGLSLPSLKKLLSAHNESQDTIYLANINTADQQVIAGRLDSIQRFIENLKQNTSIQKARVLNMSVPSHCVLLEDVSSALKVQLDELILGEPVFGYASNHSGRLLKTSEAIREDLWKSVACTVQWHDATTLLYELGTRIFIETNPSGVLSKMAESAFSDADVLAVQEAGAGPVSWLWKRFQAE